MFHKTLADGFFIFACIAIFCAMIGWAIQDIWLASTQWVLVSIVLLLMAIYVKMNEADDIKILKSQTKKNKHVSFRLTKD